VACRNTGPAIHYIFLFHSNTPFHKKDAVVVEPILKVLVVAGKFVFFLKKKSELLKKGKPGKSSLSNQA